MKRAVIVMREHWRERLCDSIQGHRLEAISTIIALIALGVSSAVLLTVIWSQGE